MTNNQVEILLIKERIKTRNEMIDILSEMSEYSIIETFILLWQGVIGILKELNEMDDKKLKEKE